MTTEQLKKSTLKINVITNEGNTYGTGFLYSTIINGKKKLFVFTNKHVVEKGESIVFRFPARISATSGNTYSYSFIRMKSIIMHPNPKVDICAIPINAAYRSAKENGVELEMESFSKNNLPNKYLASNFSAIEDIVMVGYPIADTGIFNYSPPFIAKGITSTDIKLNFEDNKEFVADVNGNNGNSGSPILLIKEHINSSLGKMKITKNIYLVGIVSAGFEYSRTYTIEKDNSSTSFNYEIGSNLIIALKWDRIREMENAIIKFATKSRKD